MAEQKSLCRVWDDEVDGDGRSAGLGLVPFRKMLVRVDVVALNKQCRREALR